MTSASAIASSTLASYVRSAVSRSPSAVLMSFPEARSTFREFMDLADEFAAGMVALGVRPGDHIGVLTPNCIESMAILIGAARVGVVPVPINSRFKTHELRYIFDNADLVAVFTADLVTDTRSFAELVGHVARPELLRHFVQLGDLPSNGFLTRSEFATLSREVAPEQLHELSLAVKPTDPALMLYTSGTTSSPKGCVISHSALLHASASFGQRLHLSAADRLWDPMPFFHIGTIQPLLACIGVGAMFCSLRHFDPLRALRQLEQERCTVALPAFETIWLGILDHPEFERTDLSHLRVIQNVAIPERLRAMQQRVPWATQVSNFGSTEVCGYVSLHEVDDPLDIRVTTGGKPFPGMRIRAVDPESGQDVEAGERGELLCKGVQLFDGYYKASELTAKVVDQNGWFHTGDLGTVDANGRVTFVTRLKDMLKIGGENVAAAEIEAYLAGHPAVSIVQVVSAPDAVYTEVAAAFVELKPGARVTDSELVDFCKGRIATYKVPRYIRFVTEWPMSGTKIQKFQLRQRITEELAQSGITEAPRMRSQT